jgi:hypothetical protein
MIKHHVIYIPGITDDIYRVQSTALTTWRLYGVHPHLHVMPWAGKGRYEDKLTSLVVEIDRYSESGKVSLVGASAGASAVINAFMERRDKVSAVVIICGKINGPETVSAKTYSENPAFETSMHQLQSNLKKLTSRDKHKMLSLYSPGDRTVPYESTVISGVDERALPAVLGHGQAIFYCLTVGAPIVISHLKRQAAL